MEIILTVLITLGVVALAFTVRGVMGLSRRVNDLELIRMELVDFEGRFEKQIENETRERVEGDDSIHRRLDEYQVQLESSTDRRFDNVWSEIHKLDKTVNPNMDSLK
tara:strand:+ start:1020 stop:1340 length:321 start_codon:yes stop_codon:yes gene_type:complete